MGKDFGLFLSLLACALCTVSVNCDFCCKTVSWGGDWCHRSDCLGYGCQLNDPATPQIDESQTVCSDISGCICSSFVTYKTKSFCTLLTSCTQAQEDYNQARKAVLLYSDQKAGESCLAAINKVVCAYHFPECLKDTIDYTQVCYDTCANMHDQCFNLTLPYFAATGLRCNYAGVAKTGGPVDVVRIRNANQGCTGLHAVAGCFAETGELRLRSVDGNISSRKLSEVQAGDMVLGTFANGTLNYFRVLFVHTHPTERQVLRLKMHGNDSSLKTSRELELTGAHLIPVVSNSEKPCANLDELTMESQRLKRGDQICVFERRTNSIIPHAVENIVSSASKVRYIVVESDFIIIDDAVVATYSTVLGWVETLPFRLLEHLFPGVLVWNPVNSALHEVLESPALAWAEGVVAALSEWMEFWTVAIKSGQWESPTVVSCASQSTP